MSTAGPNTSPIGTFQVGAHTVLLWCSAGRWSVTVDALTTEKWYMTQAAAWEAGVREADRLDRQGSR